MITRLCLYSGDKCSKFQLYPGSALQVGVLTKIIFCLRVNSLIFDAIYNFCAFHTICGQSKIVRKNASLSEILQLFVESRVEQLYFSILCLFFVLLGF